jgi:tetratricopeptide (TPR) repeat protein
VNVLKDDKQLEMAQKYLSEGKTDKALKIFLKLVAEDPDDTRMKVRLADIYIKKRNLSESLRLYQEVADSYVRDKFHLKAIATLKNVLKLDPTRVTVNEQLGDLYKEVGLTKDAVNQFLIVAEHLERAGEHEKVMEVRRKIVDTDPAATNSRIRLAEIYAKEGETEEAIAEYTKVGRDYVAQGNKEGVIEICEKLLFYKPDQPRLIVNLCQLFLEKGDANRSLEYFDGAAKLIQQDPIMMELAIDVYLKLEQRENARRMMLKLYGVASDSKDVDQAARVYGRAEAEFKDDLEYMGELDKMRTEKNIEHPATPAPLKVPNPLPDA